MLKQLKLDLKLHWGAIVVKALIPLLGLIMGAGLTVLIVKLDNEATFVCLGTLLGLAFSFLFCILWGFSYPCESMLALSMGRTRRDFLVSYALRTLMGQIAAYLVILVCYPAELALYSMVLPGYANEMELGSLLRNGWIAAGLIPGMTLLQMLIGLLYSRFGRKFATVAYILWMGCCLGGPRLLHEDSAAGQAASNAITWCGTLPAALWIGLLVCVIGAVTGCVVLLGRKQMVK